MCGVRGKVASCLSLGILGLSYICMASTFTCWAIWAHVCMYTYTHVLKMYVDVLLICTCHVYHTHAWCLQLQTAVSHHEGAECYSLGVVHLKKKNSKKPRYSDRPGTYQVVYQALGTCLSTSPATNYKHAPPSRYFAWTLHWLLSPTCCVGWSYQIGSLSWKNASIWWGCRRV